MRAKNNASDLNPSDEVRCIGATHFVRPMRCFVATYFCDFYLQLINGQDKVETDFAAEIA